MKELRYDWEDDYLEMAVWEKVNYKLDLPTTCYSHPSYKLVWSPIERLTRNL